MVGTRVRFSEPDGIADQPTRQYLTNLVRDLDDFDKTIFSEDLGLIFETARMQPMIRVNTSFGIGPYNSVVLADASAGDVTLTLPLSEKATRKIFEIKRTDDNGSFDVSVEASGPEFPVVLSGTSRESVRVFSDGANYWVL